MNKVLVRKKRQYSRLLRVARTNDMKLSDLVHILNRVSSTKRLYKLRKKHGMLLDWENKELFFGTFYLVPTYILVKGKKVSLESSISVTKAQFEAENLEC